MGAVGAACPNALHEQLVPDATAQYRRAVFRLSWAFCFIFIGFIPAQGLQSSLNGELGFINLTALYGTNALCCVAVPALIRRLEDRGVSLQGLLAACGLVYAAMIFINARPLPAAASQGFGVNVGIQIFCSLLVGLAAPVLWSAQGVYVSRCALRAVQSSDHGHDDEAVTRTMSAFNGIFFSIYQFSGVVGTSTSSAVLLEDEGRASRTLLFLVLGVCTSAGALGMLALPHRSAVAARSHSAATKTCADYCSETVAVATELRFVLLAPLIFSNGCMLGFLFADYVKSCVSAVIGPAYAGVALMTFYAFNSAASALWGALIMRGRLQLQTAMSFAFGLTLSVLVVLLLAVKKDLPIFRQNFEFRPGAADIRDEWVLDDRGYPEWWEFAAPLGCLVLAAVGDAAYESQPLALLQVWFRDERVVSAVAIKQLWHTLGYTFAFFMGALVSEFATRVAILLAMHIVSFASFCVIFYRSASSSLGEHR